MTGQSWCRCLVAQLSSHSCDVTDYACDATEYICDATYYMCDVTDYESRLRREAGPAPGGKAKRKHQIGSLYHAAKMKELEMMEMR